MSPNPQPLRRAWFIRLAGWWSLGIHLCIESGPASGRMMRYAYRNQAQGRGPIGRWIDRRFLSYPGWNGVRQRRQCLERLINQAIDELGVSPGKSIHLLDIAGGTADYVIGVLSQRRAQAISALCLDISQETVQEGRQLADDAGASAVEFQIGDVTDASTLMRLTPRPDIVICSGFYELLTDDAAVAASVEMIQTILAPGGRFIVSHQMSQPKLTGMGRLFRDSSAGELNMKMRSPQIIEQMLIAVGFAVERKLTAADLYTIFLARRV
jgi:SAM-dependent methyltransferase